MITTQQLLKLDGLLETLGAGVIAELCPEGVAEATRRVRLWCDVQESMAGVGELSELVAGQDWTDADYVEWAAGWGDAPAYWTADDDEPIGLVPTALAARALRQLAAADDVAAGPLAGVPRRLYAVQASDPACGCRWPAVAHDARCEGGYGGDAA